MIKTILKHYMFDKLLNSLFDNLCDVFKYDEEPIQLKEGDKFQYLTFRNEDEYKYIISTIVSPVINKVFVNNYYYISGSSIMITTMFDNNTDAVNYYNDCVGACYNTSICDNTVIIHIPLQGSMLITESQIQSIGPPI